MTRTELLTEARRLGMSGPTLLAASKEQLERACHLARSGDMQAAVDALPRIVHPDPRRRIEVDSASTPAPYRHDAPQSPLLPEASRVGGAGVGDGTDPVTEAARQAYEAGKAAGEAAMQGDAADGAGAEGEAGTEANPSDGQGDAQGDAEGEGPSEADEDLAHQVARAVKPILGPELAKLAGAYAKQAADAAVERAIRNGKVQRETSVTVTVETPGKPAVTIDGSHALLPEALDLITVPPQCLLLVGPKGSGKTTLARDVARALNLPCYVLPMSGGVTESAIYGRRDPLTSSYVWPQALTTMRDGGVLVIDEYDGADPNALLAMNSALANRMIAPPMLGETIDLHPQCYVIFAGNTWGRGYSAEYAARSQQDGATMDRFVLSGLEVGYDANLETRLCPFDSTRRMLLKLRANAAEAGILGWGISTRAMVKAAHLRASKGWTDKQVLANVLNGLSDDERARVEAGVSAHG